MDEGQTEKTLDDLADLFLTNPVTPSASAEVAPGANTQGADARHHLLDQHDAAAPIRLPPKPAVADGAAHANSADAETVAGFIGPQFPSAITPPDRSPQANRVEAVFLCNLPGFGRPWLTQYAHHLALSHGPVAILHVDENQFDVELVSTPDDPSLPAHQAGLVANTIESPGDRLLDCLHELSQLEPSPVRTWLVHLPIPPGRSTLARALELARWTVLIGADDPAVVSGYQLLKTLLADDPRKGQRRLGLMVLGSDKMESSTAAGKLNAAARSFLDTPVGLVGSIKRMVPVGQRGLGSFCGSEELWPSARSFMETMGGQVRLSDPPPPAEQATLDKIAEPADPLRPPDPSPAPDADTKPETLPPLPPPLRSAGSAQPSDDVIRGGEPVFSTAPAASTSSQSDGPDLAQYLPGVVRIEARCPHDPLTELGLGEDGRLHLMRHSDAEGDSLRAAILDLIEARAWASEHVTLLQLTQRQCRFDPAAEPMLHLFTNRAKPAVALTRHGPPGLQLHLLQRVSVGQAQTWCCTDLN